MKVAFRVAPNPNYKYKVVDDDAGHNNSGEHHPLSRHFQSLPPDVRGSAPPTYTTYYYPKSELDRAERNFQPVDVYQEEAPSPAAAAGAAAAAVLKGDVWLLIKVLMA